MADTKKSVFATLNAINCNEHTENKNGLTYLSWSWAWQIVKQNYPDATYTIYEREDGTPYFTDGKTAWVKTGVTIEGIEHIEYLPIMDFRNNSIPIEKITSMDMNKAIQRSLTKACARHGLGLYIYAGEDLPDGEVQDTTDGAPATPASPTKGRGKGGTQQVQAPAPQAPAPQAPEAQSPAAQAPAAAPASPQPQTPPATLTDVKKEIEASKSVDELMGVWNKHPELQGVKDFRDALAAKRAQIQPAAK